MKSKSDLRISITLTGHGLVIFLVMVIMLTSCQQTYPAETFTNTAQTDTTHELSVTSETDDGSAELLSAFFVDIPLSVSFPTGYLTDPNKDLNPATTIQVNP